MPSIIVGADSTFPPQKRAGIYSLQFVPSKLIKEKCKASLRQDPSNIDIAQQYIGMLSIGGSE